MERERHRVKMALATIGSADEDASSPFPPLKSPAAAVPQLAPADTTSTFVVPLNRRNLSDG
jgi:hypothetical protein